MSIEPTQFRKYIIRPTLRDIQYWSEEAEELLMMTAAHESHLGSYIKQVGGGPARGIYQMEGETYTDIIQYIKNNRPGINGKLKGMWATQEQMGHADYMMGNHYLATIVARAYYLRFPEPIPDREMDMAKYCKTYWNTRYGDATPQDYYDAYQKYVKEAC